MPPLNSRIRFYCGGLDYTPTIADYPSYPRNLGLDIYRDIHKSVFGSNFWRYQRGTTARWVMEFEDVSDDCAATIQMLIATNVNQGVNAPVVVYEWPGMDGISQGSLLSLTGTELVGSFFVENESWEPKERVYGNWGFSLILRKQ